jgi:hypothetical protein
LLGNDVRAGRNAYWLAPAKDDWQPRLLETLTRIIEVCQPDC